MTVSVLNITNDAPAAYLKAVRNLQLKVNLAGGLNLNVAAIIPEGPEATMEHIDKAIGCEHNIRQADVESVCNSYDMLMQSVSEELINEAAA